MTVGLFHGQTTGQHHRGDPDDHCNINRYPADDDGQQNGSHDQQSILHFVPAQLVIGHLGQDDKIRLPGKQLEFIAVPVQEQRITEPQFHITQVQPISLSPAPQGQDIETEFFPKINLAQGLAFQGCPRCKNDFHQTEISGKHFLDVGLGTTLNLQIFQPIQHIQIRGLPFNKQPVSGQ